MIKIGYDLVGDIHGQVDELVKLLEKLSYRKINGIWQHPDRKMIFLGDFVDRGVFQREVVNTVKPMIESGHAMSVMGNHEYNAIAYHIKDSNGHFLRPHTEKNNKQHQAFLRAYEKYPNEKSKVIQWFKTLPLWLDLDGIRVVHACWDFDSIEKLNTPILTDDLLQQSSIKNTWQFHAIETILKGKEISLPNGVQFYDKDGNPRHHIRTRWWDKHAKTYKEVFFGPDVALTHIPNDNILGDHLIDYREDDKPVFLGHYWMEGEIAPLADNIACLDYSVAKLEGKLVAYRWDGEQILDKEKFVFVNRYDS